MSSEKNYVKKPKRVEVNTPSGIKSILMLPVLIDSKNGVIELENTLCASCCPYVSVCEKLADPRDPSDKTKRLIDWCNESSFTDSTMTVTNDIAMMHPMAGEIEKLYDPGSEPFRQLTESNPLVPLNDFIDNVCPGFCSNYNKEHSNCNLENDFCICKDLFVKTIKPSYLNKKKDNTDDVGLGNLTY